MGHDPTPPLTTEQVAERYGISPEHLRALRARGEGPAYYRPTPRVILYRQADVDAWMEEHRVEPQETERASAATDAQKTTH